MVNSSSSVKAVICSKDLEAPADQHQTARASISISRAAELALCAPVLFDSRVIQLLEAQAALDEHNAASTGEQRMQERKG